MFSKVVFSAAVLAGLANAATHIEQTVEGASMWGEILETDNGMVVKDQYIVLFNKDMSNAASNWRDQHMSLHSEDALLHEYKTKGWFQGYAVKMSAEMAAKVSEMPEVRVVEPNGIAWATDCAPEIPMDSRVWGTIRTNNRERIITGDYYEEIGAGSNTISYDIDTGVDIEHTVFQGRATHGIDYTGEGNGDQNGHGTHVGGTMIGARFGIAQEGTMKAIKVLGRTGSGSFANVIAGILWTATDLERSPEPHGVSNLSLGGGFNTGVNDAIDQVFDQGVISVVAAGNSNADACNASPAAALKSVCVGSTTSTDARSSFSNFGCCVDIYAPGSNIWSSTPNNGYASYSGTSMAAPHIAGVIQNYWTTFESEPVERIKADILADSTPDMITSGQFSGPCTGTQCSRTDHCQGQSSWSNNNLGYSRCVQA